MRTLMFLLGLLVLGTALGDQLGIKDVTPNEKLYGKEMTSLQSSANESINSVLDSESLDWVRADELRQVSPDSFSALEYVEEKTIVKSKDDSESFIIFASWTLGPARIKEILREYNGSKNVVLKFRGILDGETMVQALGRIQNLTVETKSDVEVQIDPVAFLDSKVTEVPVTVRRLGEKKVVGIARGTASTSVFKDKKDVFDLGTLGDLAPIAERDLIEVMKERFAKLDISEIKKKAINRFWMNQKFIELPEASESILRKLDPTVVVPQEMRAPDGTLIHAAGTLINPLEIRPFLQRLVVIDPGQNWQVTLAREQIQAYGLNQLVTIILTRLPRESGWDELKKIEATLGQPAYLLQTDVHTRFDLQRVPSIVTAKEKHFYIQEVARRDMK